MQIIYDNKFDILCIDHGNHLSFDRSKYINNGIYFLYNDNIDNPIGLHIENFVKKLDDETKKRLMEKLLNDNYFRFCVKEKLKEFDD